MFFERKKVIRKEYIAEHLHVTRQAVSKWEQDQTSPDTWNLIELAKLLETSVEYITLGEEDKKSQPPIPTKSYCGKSCELCEQKNRTGLLRLQGQNSMESSVTLRDIRVL